MLEQRVGVSVVGVVLGVVTAAPVLAVTAPGTSCFVNNEGLDAASATFVEREARAEYHVPVALSATYAG